MNILILHSEDGLLWTHAVLYPADWTQAKADRLAIAAIKAAQQLKPLNWSWDDMEPQLASVGFTITNWHNGPNWDEQHFMESPR